MYVCVSTSDFNADSYTFYHRLHSISDPLHQSFLVVNTTTTKMVAITTTMMTTSFILG